MKYTVEQLTTTKITGSLTGRSLPNGILYQPLLTSRFVLGGVMRTKVCFKCKQEKSLKEFRQYKSGVNKGHYHGYCRYCEKIYKKLYKRIYYKNNPWVKHLDNARKRCENKNQSYYKLGRKCFLTVENVKYLYFRDQAFAMKRPSIDRRDNRKNYTLENCRFMELIDNIKKGGVRGELYKRII